MDGTETGRIDQFDRRIIELLLADGRMTITELASRVGLSKTPCQVRVQRLIRDRYIEGFRAVVNPAKLGFIHVAFAEVKLTSTSDEALRGFNDAVAAIPEVEECHMIAGRYDYLLKIRTTDISMYRSVLGERISSLPYVAGTSTSVVMEIVKESWGKTA